MTGTTLTKKQKARRSAIIAELSRLSRDGWANARFDDYTPLEAELRAIESNNSKGTNSNVAR